MKLKLLSAAIACASMSAYGLEGRIVAGDGQAIDGALIEVVGKRASVSTDKQGYFKLDLGQPAELHISAPGFAHKAVSLDAGQMNTAQRIVLKKP